MNSSNVMKGLFGFSIIFALFISTSAFAGNPLITSSFSGIWDQPEQESQGIILQIGEQLDEEGIEKKVGIAYWFTYGADLQTSWYLGVGDVTGNKISMVLYTASDIGFMAANLEGDEFVVPVGSLDLDFRNCNHGIAAFEFTEAEEVIDSGEFPIKRISSIYRQRCSGGISDDTPRHGKPVMMDVDMLPPDDGAGGKGKAKFWERVERVDFKVEVEDVVPDGVYTLRVCGDTDAVEQFEMPVALGVGELEFRSPESDDKLNLNFDPRNCKIELLSGEVVVLTTGAEVLSEK